MNAATNTRPGPSAGGTTRLNESSRRPCRSARDVPVDHRTSTTTDTTPDLTSAMTPSSPRSAP